MLTCASSSSMASIPASLTLSFLASDKLRFRFCSSLRFAQIRKNPKVGISVCTAGSGSIAFRDVYADDFRHLLDRQNTLILRVIPGLNELGKALLGTVAEQVMLLENIGTSVLVSKNQRPMLSADREMEQLTLAASNLIIPILKALASLISIYSFFLSLLLFIRPHCHSFSSLVLTATTPLSPRKHLKHRWLIEEEGDTFRRRGLAQDVGMGHGDGCCLWTTSIFYGVRNSALFFRSWFPVSGDLKGILIIIHGLNEHSGRYADFARQLSSCNFGVYAMDWIGHGGSDGLHGYVPSLDHVVADTAAFLEKIKVDNPGTPCFFFGHSTGGAVVLKAASYPHIEAMLEGVVLTSPALRVNPVHPIVGAVAPLFSLVAPRLQFEGANKRIPVSRDAEALLAKYSDPLVYTGAIRVRTGHEILQISSYLMRNLKSVTVPFFVLHGTADKVTDPLASQDLYNKAASEFKDIKLYDGFLHDLLFEPEREEIALDIINWMENRLSTIKKCQYS